MATITVHVDITKTVSALDANTIAAIIAWVQTNIKEKLPTDCTLNISFNIIP